MTHDLTPEELSALENAIRDREFYKRRDDTWRHSTKETDLIESGLAKLRARMRLRHRAVLPHLRLE